MKRVMWATVALVAVGLLTIDVWAQRDAGAKIRGDYGPGFRRPTTGQRLGTFPSRMPVREYDSYSVRPIGIQPGDLVSTEKDGVRVMLGRQTLGTLPKGTQFKVLKVQDGWVGSVIESQGKTFNGWVWHADVVSVPAGTEAARP